MKLENKNTIVEIIEELNLPKQILKKSESLLKTFFGPSVEDASGLISDQVKLKRFKNQILILEKAETFIKSRGINPKKINLKVLAPMIEYSSLEENETLQEKWSKLIANALTEDKPVRLKQNCVNILSQISPEEAILLDKLFELSNNLRQIRFNKSLRRESLFPPENEKKIENIKLTSIYLPNHKIKKLLDIEKPEMETLINGLESLAVIKWETPDVEVSASKYSEEPDDLDIDVDVNVHEPDGVYLTHLGLNFIKLCQI